jgi:hypothetical protein
MTKPKTRVYLTFRGEVQLRKVGKGSKQSRTAVVLETGTESYVLRREGGNAFKDSFLEGLVGKQIEVHGYLSGKTLLGGTFEIQHPGWVERHAADGFDEVFIDEGQVKFFHIERMDEGAWWMRLDLVDGRAVVIHLVSKNQEKIPVEGFVEEESAGSK